MDAVAVGGDEVEDDAASPVPSAAVGGDVASELGVSSAVTGGDCISPGIDTSPVVSASAGSGCVPSTAKEGA